MSKLSSFKGESNATPSQENLEKRVEEYKNMNESQLKNELFKQVAKQKREGKFNLEALKNMAQEVRGIVGEESYQNICSLLGELDD